MTPVIPSQILAIDGGGTRCRIALDDGQEITIVETGSANVSTDFDGALGQIRAGLGDLLAQTRCNMAQLAACPAFVGLAGVTGPAIADRLRAALPFQRLRIEDDRPAAVRGALGPHDGLIAHCGTGSFWAAQQDGEMRFAGGWGAVLGDEASAQWIARSALRKVLEAADGRIAHTTFSRMMLDRLDGTAGIVRFAGHASPAGFGQLAPDVTEHAAGGDPLARAVLQSGADEIAMALSQIGWRPGLPICLTGGIGPQFATYLPSGMQAALSAPRAEPLSGALALAHQLAEGDGR